MKTAAEILLKINDCIQNKSQYVEWLCENKTEKQLELLKKKIDNLLAVAIRNNITDHITLINLWKDQIDTAITKYSNLEHLYVVLRKIKKNKKLTSHEQLVVDCNYDWFVNKNYGLPSEEIKIADER